MDCRRGQQSSRLLGGSIQKTFVSKQLFLKEEEEEEEDHSLGMEVTGGSS